MQCEYNSGDVIQLSKMGLTWTEGDRRPDIVINIPLEPGEDLTTGSGVFRLDRGSTSAADVLVKNLSPTDSVPGYHVQFVVSWAAGDLLEGLSQQATFELIDTAGLVQTLVRFEIDVEGSLS